MKNFQRSLASLFLGFGLLFLQEGCNVKWTVVNDAYPNFHRIQQRIQMQSDQIDSNLQVGNLNRPMAQALAENLDMVRQLAWQYQSQTGSPALDLDANQTLYLDNLLNDNAALVTDAVQHRDLWAQSFQSGWNYEDQSGENAMFFNLYLHYQLLTQQAQVDDAVQSGLLTPNQAQAMRNRIQIIRNVEMSDYNQDGRLVLTWNQIQDLSQMAEDNSRFLRYKMRRNNGKWDGDHYRSWKNDRDQYQSKPVLTSPPSGSPQQNALSSKYWDGRPGFRKTQSSIPAATAVPIAAAPTATPLPAAVAVPTATSVPKWDHPHADANNPSNPNTGLSLGIHRSPDAASPSNPKPLQAQAQAPAPTAAVQPKPAGGAPSAVAKPAAAPVQLLPVDSLSARVKQQDQSIQQLRQKKGFFGPKLAIITQKRNAYNQALAGFLKQNQQKGVTQDQMNQLKKALDDVDAAISSVPKKK